MLNFCTFFDSNYILQGLALYKSLEEHCDNFHLYIVAFDDTGFDILKKLNLESATIISMQEFENEKLLTVKGGRTRAEYCWTCKPSVILYTIEKYNLDGCTYLEADTFFFDSPKVLLDELDDNSVIITGHRYSPAHDKTITSGKYCAQFNLFKNNKEGMGALKWWRDQCIEWCYARVEDGKFGDQKYLDDWLQRFSGVHELRHLGGGVAPWNFSKYKFFKKAGEIWGKETATSQEFPIIFYHFHGTNLYNIGGRIKTKSNYLAVNKNRELRKLIYRNYESYLTNVFEDLARIDYRPNFTSNTDYLFRSIQEIMPSLIKRPIKKLLRG